MYAYAMWKCTNPLFRDARVRRAMTMAANREMWQKDILLDIGVFPTGPVFVNGPEYDKTIEPWPYDLEAAKALLEEAGWKDADGNGVREKTIDGRTVEFRFKTLETSGSSPDLEAIESDWFQSLRKIGVLVEQQKVEWAEWMKRSRDREFEMSSAAWVLGDETNLADNFHSRLIPVAGSQNNGEWSHAEADTIMDRLLVEFDLAERKRLYHRFHRIWHEEQPYTILWSWRNPVAHDVQLGGYFGRPIMPQLDWRQFWWQKTGPVEYTDGRDKGKGWRRKR
jgi:peptide/nickel transport system substrate-binding protein